MITFSDSEYKTIADSVELIKSQFLMVELDEYTEMTSYASQFMKLQSLISQFEAPIAKSTTENALASLLNEILFNLTFFEKTKMVSERSNPLIVYPLPLIVILSLLIIK